MQNWKTAGISGVNASRLEQIWEGRKLRNRYLYILYVFFVDVFFCEELYLHKPLLKYV